MKAKRRENRNIHTKAKWDVLFLYDNEDRMFWKMFMYIDLMSLCFCIRIYNFITVAAKDWLIINLFKCCYFS